MDTRTLLIALGLGFVIGGCVIGLIAFVIVKVKSMQSQFARMIDEVYVNLDKRFEESDRQLESVERELSSEVKQEVARIDSNASELDRNLSEAIDVTRRDIDSRMDKHQSRYLHQPMPSGSQGQQVL